MKLARLEFTAPASPPARTPPEEGLRLRGPLHRSRGEHLRGQRGTFRFLDVAMGVMGLGKKHHLVPVEAIAEEEPGSSIAAR